MPVHRRETGGLLGLKHAVDRLDLSGLRRDDLKSLAWVTFLTTSFECQAVQCN